MLEGLPWPAITAASGGWLLFGLTMIGLITGRWIVTRREADIYIKRAERAEELNETLAAQNSELMAVARVGKATWQALPAAGRDQQEDDQP